MKDHFKPITIAVGWMTTVLWLIGLFVKRDDPLTLLIGCGMFTLMISSPFIAFLTLYRIVKHLTGRKT